MFLLAVKLKFTHLSGRSVSKGPFTCLLSQLLEKSLFDITQHMFDHIQPDFGQYFFIVSLVQSMATLDHAIAT